MEENEVGTEDEIGDNIRLRIRSRTRRGRGYNKVGDATSLGCDIAGDDAGGVGGDRHM